MLREEEMLLLFVLVEKKMFTIGCVLIEEAGVLAKEVQLIEYGNWRNY